METVVQEKQDSRILEQYSIEKKRINKNLNQMSDFLPRLEADEKFVSFLNDSLEQIARDIQHMNNNEYPIAVLANWNNGKSTFLNALIGEDILPMKNKSYTSEITRIRFGLEPKLIIEYMSGDIEDIPITGSLTSSFLVDYVTTDGSSLKDKDIQQIIIEYPLDICEEGIVLIDTPGVNSINDTHDKVTYNVIPNAKAIIMLVKIDSAGGKDDVEFLKRILPGRDPEEFDIIFVINKCDTVNQEDLDDAIESLKKALATVKDTKGNPLLKDYKICPVSSYYELQFKLFKNGRISFDDLLDDEKLFKARLSTEENVDNLTDISRFTELKQVLNDSFMGLDTTQQYIRSIDMNMKSYSQEIMSYLKQTRHALVNDKDMNQLKEEEKMIQEILKKTEIEKDEIIEEFELDFNEFEREFDHSGEYDWREIVKGNMSRFIITNEWKELQKNDGKIIIDQLKTEIQREYFKTHNYVNKYSDKLISQYNQRLINLVKNANVDIGTVTHSSLDPTISRDSLDTKNVMFNSGMAIGGVAGAAAGAGAGALIGSVIPVIGTAVGAIIGGVLGLFPGGLMGGEGKAKDTLHKKVMPQIDEQVDNAFQQQYESIIERLESLKTHSKSFFQSVIDDHRRVIENSYKKILQSKQMKEEEIQAIIQKIDHNILELEQMMEELNTEKTVEVGDN